MWSDEKDVRSAARRISNRVLISVTVVPSSLSAYGLQLFSSLRGLNEFVHLSEGIDKSILVVAAFVAGQSRQNFNEMLFDELGNFEA